MAIINNRLCTGCAACVGICPQKNISMETDEETGFYFPVKKNHCTDCNQCIKRCPVENAGDYNSFFYVDKKLGRSVAVHSVEEEIRFLSTSGGVFTELAQVILSHNGRVYGAGFDDEMNVIHMGIDLIDDIEKLRGSKYVQSRIDNTYEEVLCDLNKNKMVLFVGAPCQVAGLYAFLKKDYENLFTIEFICFGVNSPLAYKEWIRELIEEKQSMVRKVWFKYKQKGWRKSPFCSRIEFEDGGVEILDENNNYFMKGYLQGNYYVRPSCTECKFIGMRRVADIVFGDYWGTEIDDDLGMSIVITNSEKGEKIYSEIENRLVGEEVSMDDVVRNNPRFVTPIPNNPKSSMFFSELTTRKFSKVVKDYIGDNNELSSILKDIVKVCSDE